MLLLLGNLVIMGGIAASEVWPLLNGLTIGDLPNAGETIADALSASFADYRVRDAVLIALIPVAVAVLWVILRVLYFCLLVRFAGGDLGHLAMGMRVVNYRNGGRPSFGQALSRAILKQLDLLIMPWLLNGVMVLIAPERRHLYDIASNTMVVRAGRTAYRSSEPRPMAHSGPTDAPRLSENTAIPLPPSRG